MDTLQAVLAYLREMNTLSTVLRMALALLCGGLIGLDREYKRQPAGFRTHMLVCLGAATTMLLGQYEALMLTTRWAGIIAQVGSQTDVSRIGAQVVSGIGFLGAGTILLTGRQEVKGLPTAAGLWASACMGLAIGAGFYECMLVGFLLIFLSIKVLPSIENRVLASSRDLNLYLECGSISDLSAIVGCIRSFQAEILMVDMDKCRTGNPPNSCVLLSIRLSEWQDHARLISALSGLSCIRTIEET